MIRLSRVSSASRMGQVSRISLVSQRVGRVS